MRLLRSLSKYSIEIIIKTFLREEVFFNTLKSIQKHCDVKFRLFITDDSPEKSKRKLNLYNKLEKNGHVIRLYDEPIAVTKARNDMAAMTSEPYVLRIDDDFQFCKDTSIKNMIKVLKADEKIGAVSSIERQVGDAKGIKNGEISDKQGFIKIENDVLKKYNYNINNLRYDSHQGIRFAKLDYTRNFLLIKKEVLNNCKWNEDLFIKGEHIDFMLNLKKNGYKLCTTIDSIHQHVNTNESNNSAYKYYRKRYQDRFKRVMSDNWGFYKIENFKG